MELKFLLEISEKNLLNNISENFEDLAYKKIIDFSQILPNVENDIIKWKDE